MPAAGAAGTYSTAIGAGADPNTGNQVLSTGNYSVAIGGGDGVGANASRALGNLSIAIGGSAVANSTGSTVVGLGQHGQPAAIPPQSAPTTA